jgi:hypothetical protein
MGCHFAAVCGVVWRPDSNQLGRLRHSKRLFGGFPRPSRHGAPAMSAYVYPVWSHDAGVCTGESYKQVVKLTFFRGASIKDPKKLFNSSLEGNTRRAIDLREGEKINEGAFKQLIRAAVAANSAAR